MHDLRHFYACGLIARAATSSLCSGPSGMPTATTTLNTYSHLWPTAEDRTREAAAGDDEHGSRDFCGLSAD